jgi:hypothetical protein
MVYRVDKERETQNIGEKDKFVTDIRADLADVDEELDPAGGPREPSVLWGSRPAAANSSDRPPDQVPRRRRPDQHGCPSMAVCNEIDTVV